MRPASPLRRRQDWPERLAAIVEQRRQTPFAWGSHDCCLWAADVVREMTGTDLAAEFRGTYSSEAEAEDLLEARGGLQALVLGVMAAHGVQECPLPLVQRGDPLLVLQGNMPTMGVWSGKAAVLAGPDGLLFLPPQMAPALAAWAV